MTYDYNYKIEFLEDKIDKAEYKFMNVSLGMLFKIIATEVVDNTPYFDFKEDYLGAKTKNNLEIQLMNQCKVYELGEGKLYCSNLDMGKPYKTLGYDEGFKCSETYMFTRKPNNIWVLETLKCVDEGKRLFFIRHLAKFNAEPYEMVLVMTKCKVEKVHLKGY